MAKKDVDVWNIKFKNINQLWEGKVIFLVKKKQKKLWNSTTVSSLKNCLFCSLKGALNIS